jgi:hypothetical protein
MKAIFLGLYHEAVNLEEIKAKQAEGVKLWTLNDYYMFYPFTVPDAIFQIHNPEWLPVNTHGRWGGDYRKVYNTAKCPIYACWGDTGLDNEVLLDSGMLEKWFPLWMYQCSVVYMLAVALECGIKEITLEGMQFVDDGERLYQVPYVMRAITESRKNGMIVNVPPAIEATWVTCSVDWRCCEDLQPYHAKEAPTSINLRVDLPK